MINFFKGFVSLAVVLSAFGVFADDTTTQTSTIPTQTSTIPTQAETPAPTTPTTTTPASK
jgi:hypothetical protein